MGQWIFSWCGSVALMDQLQNRSLCFLSQEFDNEFSFWKMNFVVNTTYYFFTKVEIWVSTIEIEDLLKKESCWKKRVSNGPTVQWLILVNTSLIRWKYNILKNELCWNVSYCVADVMILALKHLNGSDMDILMLLGKRASGSGSQKITRIEWLMPIPFLWKIRILKNELCWNVWNCVAEMPICGFKCSVTAQISTFPCYWLSGPGAVQPENRSIRWISIKFDSKSQFWKMNFVISTKPHRMRYSLTQKKLQKCWI